MSQVVVFGNKIGAVNLMGEAMKSLIQVDPNLAQRILNITYDEIIRECAQFAYNQMLQIPGVTEAHAITDYGGTNRASEHHDQLIGMLNGCGFKRGLGIYLNKKNELMFVADGYQQDASLSTLTGYYKDAFTAQVNKAALEILGYQGVNCELKMTNNEPVFCLEGVMQ